MVTLLWLQKTHLFSTYLNVPREKMEIVSCMKGGMIENWDLFEEILDYTLKKVDRLNLIGCGP